MSRLIAIVALCLALFATAVAVAVAPTVRDAVVLASGRSHDAVLAMATGAAQRGQWAQAFTQWFTGTLIQQWLTSLMSSAIGVREKETATSHELAQGQINAEATEDTNARFVASRDTFGDDTTRSCRLAREEADAKRSRLTAAVYVKAFTRAESAATAYNPGSVDPGRTARETHAAAYCSVVDVERRRFGCTEASQMADADVTATTLFTPEGSETLSEREEMAARAYIRMVTDPAPPEDIPQGQEATAAGQRFVLEQKQHAALMSMAKQGFARVLSARVPRD